jgi:hypothetical protein
MAKLGNIEQGAYYHHKDGGIFTITQLGVYDATEEECIVCNRILPFEMKARIIPLLKWKQGDFRKITRAELEDMMIRDQKPVPKKPLGNGRKHTQAYDLPNGIFDEETLKDWYESFKPVGSGPLGVMRMACALIEELASLKGIELEP